MGKMHEKLKTKQAMKSLVSEKTKFINETIAKIGIIFDKYDWCFSATKESDNLYSVSIIKMETVIEIESINDYETKTKAISSQYGHILDSSNFELQEKKVNVTCCQQEELFSTIQKILDINIMPLEHKEEFNQLFKQPTKKKEMCL